MGPSIYIFSKAAFGRKSQGSYRSHKGGRGKGGLMRFYWDGGGEVERVGMARRCVVALEGRGEKRFAGYGTP